MDRMHRQTDRETKSEREDLPSSATQRRMFPGLISLCTMSWSLKCFTPAAVKTRRDIFSHLTMNLSTVFSLQETNVSVFHRFLSGINALPCIIRDQRHTSHFVLLQQNPKFMRTTQVPTPVQPKDYPSPTTTCTYKLV